MSVCRQGRGMGVTRGWGEGAETEQGPGRGAAQRRPEGWGVGSENQAAKHPLALQGRGRGANSRAGEYAYTQCNLYPDAW